MRFPSIALRAASTVAILGTALATALISAPAQASRSGVDAGQPARPRPSAAGAARTAALRGETGVITGVVDGAGGRPLVGACVMAAGPAGRALAVTRSDGRYSLGDLRPGRYTLHYSACAAGGEYADQWSGGASWPGGAAVVAIAPGQVRELTPVTLRTTSTASPAAVPRALSALVSGTGTPKGLAGLPSASLAARAGGLTSSAGTGAIAGAVTGRGKRLDGICVLAYGPSFRRADTTKTGQYKITKLKPGRYYVLFAEGFCGKSAGNWLVQEYKGINGPAFRGKPTLVRVNAGQTTGGIDAALKLGGEISGTVRSESGKVVPGVCVFAQGRDGRYYVSGYATSGKKGAYALHSLYPGKYQVQFVPYYCGSKGNYIPQWWRDSETQKHAKTVTITSAGIVSGVDAALRPGAILSGVVRAGSPHGALLKGICVYAYPVRSSFFQAFRAVTGKGGSYRMAGLTTGKYRVYFNRGCGNNGNYLNVQRTVSVVAGHKTSGFDAFLPFGAIITGTVTNSHGTPVRGICVVAESNNNYGSAVTRANGAYSIIALGTGSYSVSFSGGCGNSGSYAPQFYHGQVNVASAHSVRATAGHTTAGIDATMQPGGTITGVVTNASGKRLNNLCVQIEAPSEVVYGYPFNFTFTKNGVFTATNLVPGEYAVNFGCFGPPKLANQWFMGQPGQGSADYVSAPAGVVTSDVNAVLRSGGFITGVVTNRAGKRVPETCVQAIPHGSPFQVYSFFSGAQAFTNSRGVYRIGPLGAAKYDVQFDCYEIRYGIQWYKGTSSRASATPVSVANGATATGIDGVLGVGGSISGEVTTGANRPQADICVYADDAADQSTGNAYTNKHGQYKIQSLSSGSYEITYTDCGYGKHHVPLGTGAKVVTVVAPHALTGVNEQLFPAGSISGHVNGGPRATPQAGVCVVADPVSPNNGYQYSFTDSRGNYRLTDLAPGAYQVYFGDPFCAFGDNAYAPQWYKDKTAQSAATNVTVTSGDDTGAIDATLGSDGAISGTVTSRQHGRGQRPGGTPIAGECVTATPVAPVPDPLLDAVPHPTIGVTAADGTYSLVGLLPGRYTVKFSVGCGDSGFETQWWSGARSAGQATVITVPASTTVTGIDARLRH